MTRRLPVRCLDPANGTDGQVPMISSGRFVLATPSGGSGGGTSGGDATWTAAILGNSWANYGTPYAPAGYRKDANGIVHLRGLIKLGTMGAAAFTLPTGYRPPYELGFSVPSTSTSTGTSPATGRVDVLASGAVVPQTGYGSNGFYFLDGVSFYTD